MTPPGGGTAAPQPKVVAAGLGGALATIVVWLIGVLFRVDVPPAVAAAIATVFSFAAGYITPPNSSLSRLGRQG